MLIDMSLWLGIAENIGTVAVLVSEHVISLFGIDTRIDL
jgi:hypothetical protein